MDDFSEPSTDHILHRGPEEDHQLHHCCWTGRVSKREEDPTQKNTILVSYN